MSTVDVGPPPPGPNLQDPTSGRTEIVADPGPDGRGTVVESVVVKKVTAELPDEPEATSGQQQSEENKENKESNKINVTFQEDNPKTVTMDTAQREQRLSEKIAESSEKPEAVENDSVLENESRERVIDIVKQSKIVDRSSSRVLSESGEYPEFPQSRPLTETTNRDGTRASVDGDKREPRFDVERDAKTPFSVVVERKPLHTAQTRSHSDYYSKTPSTSRYTYIAASLSQFSGFNQDIRGLRNQYRQAQIQRTRRPPKLVRLATVTMSPKTKPIPRGPSLYYEEPKKPAKLVTWDEAMEARPPLRIDNEGPGPTHYSPRVKPLHETNSPAWTFGSRCFTEKAGGSRTSWEKTWFQNPSVWTSKVDFYNDSGWPSPTHYRQRPLLGPRQKTMVEAPSFTIGTRKEMTLNKIGSEKEPSPVDYDKDTADKLTLKTSPAFSHQFRREGTVMWSGRDKVPGPGSYTPNYSYNKPHGPNFSIRSLRREKSHVLGPFSTL